MTTASVTLPSGLQALEVIRLAGGDPAKSSVCLDSLTVDGVTQDDLDAAVAAYDPARIPAPPPLPPSPREWLERLSSAKQNAITAASLQNASILLWVIKASGSPVIDVTAPETQEGVAALVAAGVLDATDQALLLAP